MPICHLNSLDDRRLEPFRHLKDTNATRGAGLLVAEGEKLVTRLLASDYTLVSILLGQSYVAQFADRVPTHVSVLVVPDESIESLVGFNFHRGVLACARRKPDVQLDELCAPGDGQLTLSICPDVQDPENLGAILRTSRALGIDGVLLGQRAGDPLSRRVLRVSMGAALQLPIRQSEQILDDLARLHGEFAVELWAAVLEPDAEPLPSVARPRRLGVLFGSEGHGLPQECIAACQRRITIPMQPGADSLNVAVAAGIVLHHVMSDTSKTTPVTQTRDKRRSRPE